jgi:hypothetical protein
MRDFRKWLTSEEFSTKDDAPQYAAKTFGGSASQYHRLGAGGQKTSVLMPDGKRVARLYHDRSQLDYRGSEGRISDILGNDKLAAKINFVPGKGYDLAERVLPLEDHIRAARRTYKTGADGQPLISSKSGRPMTRDKSFEEMGEENHRLMMELIKSYNANPLFKNVVEASPLDSSGYGKNTGVVKREGKAYVVAFDLDAFSDDGWYSGMKANHLRRLGRVARPYGISLEMFHGTFLENEINKLS